MGIFFLYSLISRGFYSHCGNTIKYPSSTKTCDKVCNGNSAQYCGDKSGQYSSVYTLRSKWINDLWWNIQKINLCINFINLPLLTKRYHNCCAKRYFKIMNHFLNIKKNSYKNKKG